MSYCGRNESNDNYFNTTFLVNECISARVCHLSSLLSKTLGNPDPKPLTYKSSVNIQKAV